MSGALRLVLPFFRLELSLSNSLTHSFVDLISQSLSFRLVAEVMIVLVMGDGTLALFAVHIQSSTNTSRHSPLSRFFWRGMISAFVIYIGCVFGFHNLLSKSSISKHQHEE